MQITNEGYILTRNVMRVDIKKNRFLKFIKVHKISINEELEFDTSQKEFLLEYSKETDKASLFILFYEKSGNLEITLTIPDFENPETTKIHDDNGYIYFPFTKDGDYYISFGQISEEDTFKGKFKVITY